MKELGEATAGDVEHAGALEMLKGSKSSASGSGGRQRGEGCPRGSRVHSVVYSGTR